MPFWLVFIDTYGADFLKPSFIICISKHHHQTDFSKRLTSWKANTKFENPAKGKTFIHIYKFIHTYIPYHLHIHIHIYTYIKGKTLKKFVKNLKNKKGIDYVFVWHALSGYWGGVSTDVRDDMYSALSKKNPVPVSPVVIPLKQVKSTLSRFLSRFFGSDSTSKF
jgi:hypothetical protein